MRLVMLTAALALTACAGSGLDNAIRAHNATKSLVSSADQAFVQAYRAADAAADAKYPLDEAAYARAMAPYDDVASGLTAAKMVAQGMHLGIEQWQAGYDDGSLTRESAACGVDAILFLGRQASKLSDDFGPWLSASALVLAEQLKRFADGATCTVKP